MKFLQQIPDILGTLFHSDTGEKSVQSTGEDISKCKNCTLDELVLLKTLDKIILVQYCDMKEEIKDIRRRISDLEKSINHLEVVSDSVKGTRQDGIYGNIKITGYPTPDYYRKKAALEKYKALLDEKEAELLELTCEAEEYIESIDKPELRVMFRLYYIDGLTWVQVAHRMMR